MNSEDNREQQICKAWAGEADRADKLEALIAKLVETCKGMSWALHGRALDERETSILINADDVLSEAKQLLGE